MWFTRTHYWKMPDQGLSDEVIVDLEDVFDRHRNVICHGFNHEQTPSIEKDMLTFNGIDEQAQNPLIVERDGHGFCETNKKDYDVTVCESLLVLKHHYGDDFELGSFGFCVDKETFENCELDGSWNEAIGNLKEVHGWHFYLDRNMINDGDVYYYSFDVHSLPMEWLESGIEYDYEIAHNLKKDNLDVFFETEKETNNMVLNKGVERE